MDIWIADNSGGPFEVPFPNSDRLVGPLNVRLFPVLSTIGTAIDLTLQELRIESFFPADAESERRLKALLG